MERGEPTVVQLANSWVIINVGGGPTDDKPEVTLETPPDPTRRNAFLNIRVADIQRCYEDWGAKGAKFTPSRSSTRRRFAATSAIPTGT